MPPMQPMADIYFNQTRIIVAPTRIYARRQAPCCPFHDFLADVSQDELGRAIVESLAASKTETSEEVFEREFKEFCKSLGVVGWRSLESEYFNIQVYQCTPTEVELYEFQKCRGGGYASDKKPRRLPTDFGELGTQVLSVVTNHDENYYDDGGPSHT